MEDLKQIQEFFSKPLEEMMSLDDQAKAYYLAKVKRGEIDTLPEDPKAAFLAQMTKDQMDHDKETLRRERGLEEDKKLTYNDFVQMVRDDMMAGASPDGYVSDERVKRDAKRKYNEYLQGANVDDLFEADVPVSEDIPDIIAVDVPLFIRLLEFAREDSKSDLDLHDIAERAIEAVKLRGVLSMDDYETLIPSGDLDEGKLVVTKDKIDNMARRLAAQISKQKNTSDAQDFLRKAIEDAYAKVFASDEYEIREEEGYSQYLKDDPEFPGGKTKGLTPDVMNKILMKIVQDIDETKKLGKNLNEELCPKGKAYIKKRMAAGEKSSAYLSGRAVKVCKGQMEG